MLATSDGMLELTVRLPLSGSSIGSTSGSRGVLGNVEDGSERRDQVRVGA